ncbi:MAG: hypothetical protein OSB25_11365 [Salibacteraceae bacterium]|nr:hypothetical protein [Salibacteraceae bacterium]
MDTGKTINVYLCRQKVQPTVIHESLTDLLLKDFPAVTGNK